MFEQRSHYVTDWLDKRAKLTPHRIGLVEQETGVKWSYQEWNARANRTANFLLSLGVGKGDLVSVYSGNCAAYLDLLFACGKIGAVVHNLNWRLTVFELERVLADAGPKLLCYSGQWQRQVGELRRTLSPAQWVVALDTPAAGDIAFSRREQFPAETPPRPEMRLDDAWGIFYTGGTTGLPKGAVLTHGNMTWNSVSTITSWGLTGEDAAALQLPLFHIGGPNIFMLPLVHTGGKTILCREFDVEQTFDLIEAGEITLFVGVPTMYVMLQQHRRWPSADFSRLKLVISGGAPCPLSVMQKFWDKGVDFKLGYGLTEASGNNFWLPPEDVQRKPGSVGHPLFHIDARIIDESGRDCVAEDAGELLLRGPNVTPGYWKRPEETAATIVDGWLHTGDLARRDADGCFYIIGRSKEMFISGGENVYPAEVESAMHAHPAVAEAALIGVPHEKWGEVGKAFVVAAGKARLSEKELLEFLSKRLAKYKLPSQIVFVAELPKTAIGKIDKKTLRCTGGCNDRTPGL